MLRLSQKTIYLQEAIFFLIYFPWQFLGLLLAERLSMIRRSRGAVHRNSRASGWENKIVFSHRSISCWE